MLRVNEIFRSIQGESTHSGRPCAFVRLTGCNLRCLWCDTAFAFHDGRDMSLHEVLDEVARLGLPLVEVTGGEPLLQEEAVPLMEALVARGYEVLLETGGSLPIDRVPEGVRRIIDLKCPGSGESSRNLWSNLESLRPGDELKFVLANRHDYDWARTVVHDLGLAARCPVLFSAVHETLGASDLAAWILEDRLPVRLQIQLHKVLWPGVLRGV